MNHPVYGIWELKEYSVIVCFYLIWIFSESQLRNIEICGSYLDISSVYKNMWEAKSEIMFFMCFQEPDMKASD